jgi:hypothetical protein
MLKGLHKGGCLPVCTDKETTGQKVDIKGINGTRRKGNSKATGWAYKLLERPVSCSSSFLSFSMLSILVSARLVSYLNRFASHCSSSLAWRMTWCMLRNAPNRTHPRTVKGVAGCLLRLRCLLCLPRRIQSEETDKERRDFTDKERLSCLLNY